MPPHPYPPTLLSPARRRRRRKGEGTVGFFEASSLACQSPFRRRGVGGEAQDCLSPRRRADQWLPAASARSLELPPSPARRCHVKPIRPSQSRTPKYHRPSPEANSRRHPSPSHPMARTTRVTERRQDRPTISLDANAASVRSLVRASSSRIAATGRSVRDTTTHHGNSHHDKAADAATDPASNGARLSGKAAYRNPMRKRGRFVFQPHSSLTLRVTTAANPRTRLTSYHSTPRRRSDD